MVPPIVFYVYEYAAQFVFCFNNSHSINRVVRKLYNFCTTLYDKLLTAKEVHIYYNLSVPKLI